MLVSKEDLVKLKSFGQEKCGNKCGKDGVRYYGNGSLLCQICYDEWLEKNNPKNDEEFEMITGR